MSRILFSPMIPVVCVIFTKIEKIRKYELFNIKRLNVKMFLMEYFLLFAFLFGHLLLI